MTQTPDLSRPYGSDAERRADRDKLVSYWQVLEPLIDLAKLSPDQWSEWQEYFAAKVLPQASKERSGQRLTRWASLYGEELELIKGVRKKVVGGDIVTDPELLGATWLARQVIATVAGIEPSQVDQRWIRSVSA
jgi:hypothetical protein